MNDATYQLIQQIHEAPGEIVFVTAGAGTQALADLFAIAGASKTMLEAIVPYSKTASIDFLGKEPHKFVSSTSSGLLAGRALRRAIQLSNSGAPLVGISCTAAIATNRPKKGPHHAYITAWSPKRITTHHLILDKGARTRAEEERLISRLILNTIASAFGIHASLALPLLEGDKISTEVFDFERTAHTLFANEIPYFAIHDFGRIRRQEVNPQVILSGSFNPLHEGHLTMARAAMQHLDKPLAFEIAAINADKPSLDVGVILQRLTQFAGAWPVYVTSTPTFVEKARIFGATTFVIGFDTAARIIEPRFYNNDENDMLAALTELQTAGCQFLVAGRVNKNGVFQTVADLNTPSGFEELFEQLPNFRLDLSSTEIRAKGLTRR